MSLKDKIARKQLKAMGIDLSDPTAITFKTIRTLINTSVPSLIGQKQMIEFLEDQITQLKKEYGE